MTSGEDEKYGLQDELDKYLAKDISKYIMPNQFKAFANHLRVPQYEMDRIMPPGTVLQDEHVKQVS